MPTTLPNQVNPTYLHLTQIPPKRSYPCICASKCILNVTITTSAEGTFHIQATLCVKKAASSSCPLAPLLNLFHIALNLWSLALDSTGLGNALWVFTLSASHNKKYLYMVIPLPPTPQRAG